jgi:hypothetical protein
MTEHKQTSGTLSRSQLIFAQLTWLVLGLLFAVVGLVGRYQLYRDTLLVCETCSITPEQVQYLQGIGLTVDFYRASQLFLLLVWPLGWAGIGLLIFLRKSNDRVGLLLSGMMVATGFASSWPPLMALAEARPSWVPLILTAALLSNFAFTTFLYTFPSGRFIPRSALLLVVAFAMINVADIYREVMPAWMAAVTNWPAWFSIVVLVATVISFVPAQIYRYRRVSTFMERQQTKWVVYAIAAAMSLFLLTASTVLLPGGNPEDEVSFTTLFIQPFGWSLSTLLIPIAVAIAVLRYRLFDIDVIIRKTIVYTTLTTFLALIYIGTVVLLQSLFRALAVGRSPLAIVASTLVIAALFTPLRRRLQATIDRRFYRRKYNAAHTLTTFAQTARDEVDLDLLTAELTRVVGETMQPESITLWLKPPVNRKPAITAQDSAQRLAT